MLNSLSWDDSCAATYCIAPLLLAIASIQGFDVAIGPLTLGLFIAHTIWIGRLIMIPRRIIHPIDFTDVILSNTHGWNQKHS